MGLDSHDGEFTLTHLDKAFNIFIPKLTSTLRLLTLKNIIQYNQKFTLWNFKLPKERIRLVF